MSIRKAEVSDSWNIANLLVRSWQFAYKGIMEDSLLEKLSVKQREIGWKNHLESGAEVYVKECDGKLIGIIEVSDFRDNNIAYQHYAEIPVIYLDPEYIGKGYGKKLFGYAENVIVKKGISQIAIWVLNKNISATNFYKKIGFVNSGTNKLHDKTGLTEDLYIKNT